MIPKTGWRDMESAPRDGTILIAKYRHNNARDGKVAIHAVQWLPDESGANWTWRKPWHFGTMHYVDAWMTPEQFMQAQIEEETIPKEFDL